MARICNFSFLLVVRHRWSVGGALIPAFAARIGICPLETLRGFSIQETGSTHSRQDLKTPNRNLLGYLEIVPHFTLISLVGDSAKGFLS
jgi:hypothetical protein